VQLFISRNGEQLGTWSPEEVRHYFQTGNLVATDHYWHEGMAQWDTLGNLLPSPPPATILPPPPVPAQRLDPPPSSRLAWIVPIVLAGVLALFVEPVTPVTNEAEKIGQITGGIILFLLVAFPVSLLFPRAWRLAVRCGLILVLGLLTVIGKQHLATENWLTEANKFGRQESEDEKKQFARDGSITPDPAKFNREIQKLRDISSNENGQDKKLTDFALEMMKDLIARGLACRAQEQPMITLGVGPSRLTSLAEIDKRRAAVQAPQASIENFIAYLTDFDTSVHAELITQGNSPATADGFIHGMDGTGKIKNLLTYWQMEDAILKDLLANLDILKKNWGQWKMDGDKVIFQNDDGLAAYRANIVRMNADVAAQNAVQAKLLEPNKPPASQ
jgi:hypothetical protein